MVGEEIASHPYRHWPAATTALLSLAIALVVWFVARDAERTHIRRMAGLATQAIREDLGADTESWVQDLVQLSKLWELRNPSQSEWKANIALYLRHHPGCLELEHLQIGNTGNGRAQAPNGARVPAELDGIEDDPLARVSATGSPVIASAGNRRAVIIAPVKRDGRIEGVIVATIDVRQWFHEMLSDVVPLGYSIAIRDGGIELYHSAEDSPQDRWRETTWLSLPGVNWELSVWPRRAMLDEMASHLPEAALLACVLLGIMSTLAVHLARQSAIKSSRLQIANRRLAAAAEEQHVAETALRSAQARLTAILEDSVDAVVCLNQRLQITLFNHAAETMFGYTEHEILGQSLDILIPERFRAVHRRHVARFDASAERNLKMSNRRPVFGLRKDGSEFPIDAPLTRLEINGERVFNVIIRDVTERVRSQQELLRSRDELELRVTQRTSELQELSNRLAQLQDEDRRRIARELHDGTTQILIALNVDLGMLGHMLGESEPRAQQMLVNSRELVKQCLDELRTVSYLLHPPLLDELGLELALRNYVKGFGSRSEIRIDMHLPEGLDEMPRDVQVATFRIVQEALTNIHRHSESLSAKIAMQWQPGGLRMEISDQGKGIPSEVLNDSSHAGIGIASMRERVRQLGGTFCIESGRGTTIYAVLPIPKSSASPDTPEESKEVAIQNGLARGTGSTEAD